MGFFELSLQNLTSPIVLGFILGFIAKFFKSELEFPEQVLKAISAYLMLAIGLKAGTELANADFSLIIRPILIVILLTSTIPYLTFVACRRIGKLRVEDAAALGAHYGSVSAVTFFAGLSFINRIGAPSEGYFPILLAIMEWGAVVGIFIAKFNIKKLQSKVASSLDIINETMRSAGFTLLAGGITIGYIIGAERFQEIAPVFQTPFKGVLVIFLIELGMKVGDKLSYFKSHRKFLAAFAIIGPIIFASFTLSVCYIFSIPKHTALIIAIMSSSASYIYAPAAVKASIPNANEGIYLPPAIGITFPFNLIIGIPLYNQILEWIYR